MDEAPDISLNICSRFSTGVSHEFGSETDCRSAMGFDGRDECIIVGKLDFDGPSSVDYMTGCKRNKNVDFLLVDVKFILGAKNFNAKISDGSSELQPTSWSDGILDDFGPSF